MYVLEMEQYDVKVHKQGDLKDKAKQNNNKLIRHI